MSIYRIRLHQAWKVTPISWSQRLLSGETVAIDRPLPPSGKGAAGQPWTQAIGEFRGLARYERNFHPPTNLAPDDRVFLVCEAFADTANVFLAEHDFGGYSVADLPLRLDITEYLAPNCRLRIDIESPLSSDPWQGGLTGGVWLEIISPDQPPPRYQT